MSTKINKEEILKQILSTLVKGWGVAAVRTALDSLAAEENSPTLAATASGGKTKKQFSAVAVVADLGLTGELGILMAQLASDFDAGLAFSRVSDIRAFLVSHHRPAKDLKSRDQGFRKLLPVLLNMSEKGLQRVLVRSMHSGPAELGSISEAIKGAGHSIRGGNDHPDNETNE